jgi:hypothetical protein
VRSTASTPWLYSPWPSTPVVDSAPLHAVVSLLLRSRSQHRCDCCRHLRRVLHMKPACAAAIVTWVYAAGFGGTALPVSVYLSEATMRPPFAVPDLA